MLAIILKQYEDMGDEITNALGFENDIVIEYWTNLEKGHFLKCDYTYNMWKKGRLF